MSFTCDCGKEHTDIIPKTRFDEVYRERRDLKADKAALQAQLDDAKKAGEGSEALKATNEQLREQLAAANSRFETHQTISSYGITDPDTVKAIEFFAPKDQPLGETLSGWREAPETAPSVLRAMFAAPTPPQAPQAGTHPPAAPEHPNAAPPQAAPPAVTPPTPAWPNVNQGAQTPPTTPTPNSHFFDTSRSQLEADVKNPDSAYSQALNKPLSF